MKKLFFIIAVMFVWTNLPAQTNAGHEVNYYGIDFSGTKTFGATESGWEFKEAFDKINALVIAEWRKYNPGKFLDKKIEVMDITATERINDGIEPSAIDSGASVYSLTKDDMADMVSRYELQEGEGTGLVILGEFFDKSNVRGSFVVVYFDIATREVLDFFTIAGKARGFGLRNFWAGALYDGLKGLK